MLDEIDGGGGLSLLRQLAQRLRGLADTLGEAAGRAIVDEAAGARGAVDGLAVGGKVEAFATGASRLTEQFLAQAIVACRDIEEQVGEFFRRLLQQPGTEVVERHEQRGVAGLRLAGPGGVQPGQRNSHRVFAEAALGTHRAGATVGQPIVRGGQLHDILARAGDGGDERVAAQHQRADVASGDVALSALPRSRAGELLDDVTGKNTGQGGGHATTNAAAVPAVASKKSFVFGARQATRGFQVSGDGPALRDGRRCIHLASRP